MRRTEQEESFFVLFSRTCDSQAVSGEDARAFLRFAKEMEQREKLLKMISSRTISQESVNDLIINVGDNIPNLDDSIQRLIDRYENGVL
ncbi:MAG TPA: hypothetical protein VG895_02715 [Patescibacteria group bacterium]|nr:hypothetical protein [Patescibacteria group bacterium]